jgi:acetyl esterase/lipase
LTAGGGFSLDGGSEHLSFWSHLRKELAKTDQSVSFLFLAYTLVPFGTYPVQFREGVEVLEYVLNDLGRLPSDVILAGDSAGGNMCLAVLSHLSHPSPDVPEVKIDSKLKAAVLVAPWVSFKTGWASFQRNQSKDFVVPSVISMWSLGYLAGWSTSPYAEAVEAPTSWWQGAKVEQLLCVAGSDEILLDPITKWVEKYKVWEARPHALDSWVEMLS